MTRPHFLRPTATQLRRRRLFRNVREMDVLELLVSGRFALLYAAAGALLCWWCAA